MADKQLTATKFGFLTHTTALWPMEQSSFLSAEFDCPVARQNYSLLATAHDCEPGLSGKFHLIAHVKLAF